MDFIADLKGLTEKRNNRKDEGDYCRSLIVE
jgi:hypothetical protein